MITNMLLSFVLASPPVEVGTEAVQAIDLGKLTWEEAKRLEGKIVRVSFQIGFVRNPFRIFSATASGNPGPHRNVVFSKMEYLLPQKETLIADGILRTWVQDLYEDGEMVPNVRVIQLNDTRIILKP